jgi:hypothetical protein
MWTETDSMAQAKRRHADFIATRKVKEPTEVTFTTRTGANVDFVARKPAKEKVDVSFMARNKEMRKRQRARSSPVSPTRADLWSGGDMKIRVGTVLLFSGAIVAYVLVATLAVIGTVPQGDAAAATSYYRQIAADLDFHDPSTMLDSTLDDALAYLGYAGLSALDAEVLSSAALMDPTVLGRSCQAPICPGAVSNPALFQQTFGPAPLQTGEILASRFFAPKLINVNDQPATRKLGWRKLVRLHARKGSKAEQHGIDAGIVLFNFFTDPGKRPFSQDADSVNTQVMLTTLNAGVTATSIYWLDYGKISDGGKLSLELDACFDAADFQDSVGSGLAPGVKAYFVPDGCNGCHGDDAIKPLINYLDTDHWFDRIDNDFSRVKDEGVAVLFDAGTDDSSNPHFAPAFNVIRRFNQEAERHASIAKPNAPHRLAARTWLANHTNSDRHFAY